MNYNINIFLNKVIFYDMLHTFHRTLYFFTTNQYFENNYHILKCNKRRKMIRCFLCL